MYNRIKYINDSYRHNMSEQYERNVHVKCAFFIFFFFVIGEVPILKRL